MLIKLTQEHIDGGERQCCRRCPVAKAIQVACNKPAWVAEQYVEIESERWDLPEVAVNFIRNFDGEVEGADPSKCVPFEFELDL